MNHKWCLDINWQNVLLKNTKPPFVPNIYKSNFDPEYVRDASLARQNRPRMLGKCSAKSSVHSYAYNDSFEQ